MSESDLHSQYRTGEIHNRSMEEAFGPAIESLEMPSQGHLLARHIVALTRQSATANDPDWERMVYEACEGALRDQDRIIAYLQKCLREVIALISVPVVMPITETPCPKGPSDV